MTVRLASISSCSARDILPLSDHLCAIEQLQRYARKVAAFLTGFDAQP
jgi:hypothetical protein